MTGIRSSFNVHVAPAALRRRETLAFTFFELLLAIMIFSLVIAAVNAVFFSALRLRNATTRGLEQSMPRERAFDVLRRDLKAALPPGGGMVGDFRTGVSGMTLENSAAGGLEFCTATARINETDPWGDVQRVVYQLRDAQIRSGNQPMGKELVRSVSRNLLPSTADEPTDQFLLGNVESMEVLCFDGSSWRSTWDTSMSDTNLPVAVRVRLLMTDSSGANAATRQPYELLVPLVSLSRTNMVDTGESDTSTTTTTTTSGGTP